MAQISAKKASQITVTFSFIWSLINLTNLSRDRKSPERLFLPGAWLGTWLDTFILTSQTWFIVAWSWPVNKEDDSLVLQFLKKQKTKHNELGWASGCSCVRIVSQRGYVSAWHSGNPQAKTISLFSVRENRKIQSSFSNNSFRLTNLQPCKHTYWFKKNRSSDQILSPCFPNTIGPWSSGTKNNQDFFKTFLFSIVTHTRTKTEWVALISFLPENVINFCSLLSDSSL